MWLPPLFMTQYSYLGLDPNQILFRGNTYFNHFNDFCRVQVRYAESKSNVFKGYGPLFGLTAKARDRKSYRVFSPGESGTTARWLPPQASSSMPYVPDDSLSCLVELYTNHGYQIMGGLLGFMIRSI